EKMLCRRFPGLRIPATQTNQFLIKPDANRFQACAITDIPIKGSLPLLRSLNERNTAMPQVIEILHDLGDYGFAFHRNDVLVGGILTNRIIQKDQRALKMLTRFFEGSGKVGSDVDQSHVLMA